MNGNCISYILLELPIQVRCCPLSKAFYLRFTSFSLVFSPISQFTLLRALKIIVSLVNLIKTYLRSLTSAVSVSLLGDLSNTYIDIHIVLPFFGTYLLIRPTFLSARPPFIKGVSPDTRFVLRGLGLRVSSF